ncbi:site-specific integrase [Streptomyces lutosisoli]|uniref:Site-specific integrase n=1 Tax=Streptomyces lutosisoli TaxID=2665721 RepID=A0ABW2VX63_9ACTN
MIGQRGLDVKTMRAYAYTVLMLLNFLTARGLDLRLATENNVLEFQRLRREDAEETVGEATWDRDAAAIGGLYDYLAQVGYVSGRPWRAKGRGESLGSGVSRDPRVRHMELDQYLLFRDVGFGGLEPGGGLDLAFRGWRPHRNRSALELALMTGMRIQEWSTLLLPELALVEPVLDMVDERVEDALAAVSCRGEEVLQVVVSVSAYSLAVQSQSAADGAEGHAGGGQLVDLLVTLPDPVQEGSVRDGRRPAGLGIGRPS